MIVSTTDPISLNDVADLDNAPYVIEGDGHYALKIYFENEANKREYLNIPLHTPDSGVLDAYAKASDSDITGTIN